MRAVTMQVAAQSGSAFCYHKRQNASFTSHKSSTSRTISRSNVANVRRGAFGADQLPRKLPVISTKAAHTVYEGHLVAHPDARYGVVVARFNDLVTKLLLDGSVGALQRHGVQPENIDVAWVPGSFELPVVAKTMAETGKFDAVICIGTVVRGATTHYEAVVSGATSGVLNASISTGVPVIFGVLTCDTMEQALDRAGGKVGNKGAEAAVTAVEMGNLMRSLRADGKAAPLPQ